MNIVDVFTLEKAKYYLIKLLFILKETHKFFGCLEKWK